MDHNRIIRGKIGTGKSSTQPQALLGLLPDFRELESCQLHQRHPACERLRTLPAQFRCRAAQEQKLRGLPRPIRQNPQHRKNFRPPLRFIDHHQPAQIL